MCGRDPDPTPSGVRPTPGFPSGVGMSQPYMLALLKFTPQPPRRTIENRVLCMHSTVAPNPHLLVPLNLVHGD